MPTRPGSRTWTRRCAKCSQKVTKGSLSGNAGETAKEDFKINGQYVDTPVIDGKEGVVGIPFFDGYVEKAAIEFLDDAAKTPNQPFFINVNFMKVHQPNMPAPEFEHKSLSKSKYADSVVELDTRIGRIMDKLRETGMDKNTLVFYTTDNGAWQDVYPDAGYTPFRGTKGTVREGGNRVPAIAVWPGKTKPGSKNHEIIGGLDLMATFASAARVPLPTNDREDKPIIFDSYRHDAGADRHGQVAAHTSGSISPRTSCRPAPPASATTRPCSTCAATTARRPAVWRSIPTSAGRARRSTSPRCRRCSTCGRTRRSAMTSS